MSLEKRPKLMVAPPHSMFFVRDPDIEVIPKIDGQTLRIWATTSCLVIGCLMFQDGETDLTLRAADEADRAVATLAADRAFSQVFDGLLESPNKRLAISTSEKTVLLRLAVAASRSRVRGWTNHPTEPERIFVLVI